MEKFKSRAARTRTRSPRPIDECGPILRRTILARVESGQLRQGFIGPLPLLWAMARFDTGVVERTNASVLAELWRMPHRTVRNILAELRRLGEILYPERCTKGTFPIIVIGHELPDGSRTDLAYAQEAVARWETRRRGGAPLDLEALQIVPPVEQESQQDSRQATGQDAWQDPPHLDGAPDVAAKNGQPASDLADGSCLPAGTPRSDGFPVPVGELGSHERRALAGPGEAATASGPAGYPASGSVVLPTPPSRAGDRTGTTEQENGTEPSDGSATSADRRRKVRPSPQDNPEVRDIWEQYVKATGSEARLSTWARDIEARIRSNGVERVHRAVKAIAESSFWRGQNRDGRDLARIPKFVFESDKRIDVLLSEAGKRGAGPESAGAGSRVASLVTNRELTDEQFEVNERSARRLDALKGGGVDDDL